MSKALLRMRDSCMWLQGLGEGLTITYRRHHPAGLTCTDPCWRGRKTLQSFLGGSSHWAVKREAGPTWATFQCCRDLGCRGRVGQRGRGLCHGLPLFWRLIAAGEGAQLNVPLSARGRRWLPPYPFFSLPHQSHHPPVSGAATLQLFYPSVSDSKVLSKAPAVSARCSHKRPL